MCGINGTSYGNKLYRVSKAVIGSYVILYVNPALPHAIFLLKYKNPVSVHWDNELGALFFSSRYIFLRKTFGRFDASMLNKHKEHPVRQFSLFSNAEK
ncbi:MAG: hypothetical protein Q3M30_09175 [Candidatus Electrothrix sp. Rat3]|nr:hypothetical protein [Candidatus Electrothrix rattekaaiensis]